MHARDHMLVMEEHSDFSIQGTISSISRAIWADNTKLAEIILKRSEFARRHIQIHDDTFIQNIEINNCRNMKAGKLHFGHSTFCIMTTTNKPMSIGNKKMIIDKVVFANCIYRIIKYNSKTLIMNIAKT